MLTPELQKITKAYDSIMLEVRNRILLINSILKGESTIGVREVDYETIAMTFRRVAELIVFANLIGHESEYSALYANIENEWNMGKLINRIKAINPGYYPIAWLPVEIEGVENSLGLAEQPEGDTMTETELIDMYGKCSDLIHAHNPFKGEIDYSPYIVSFHEWSSKLLALLGVHGIMLSDNKHMIVCMLASVTNDTKPEAVIYEVNHDTHEIKLLS